MELDYKGFISHRYIEWFCCIINITLKKCKIILTAKSLSDEFTLKEKNVGTHIGVSTSRTINKIFLL